MVLTVSVAVTGFELVTFTGLVAPKVTVGGYRAPAGIEATTAVSATTPLKPPEGATVTVDVFPWVPPALIVTAVPERLKPAITGLVTTTEALPVPVANSESPE
jgi:hypothetical protein